MTTHNGGMVAKPIMTRTRTRRSSVLTLIAALSVVLTACTGPTSPGGTPDMDKAAVATAIEQVPTVVSVEIGSFNTGTPGSTAAQVDVTLDDADPASVGAAVDGAVRAVAADPGDYRAYRFEVAAPEETEGADAGDGEVIVLTLSRYRDSIPFAEGEYVGSTLTLTPEELAAIAAR